MPKSFIFFHDSIGKHVLNFRFSISLFDVFFFISLNINFSIHSLSLSLFLLSFESKFFFLEARRNRAAGHSGGWLCKKITKQKLKPKSEEKSKRNDSTQRWLFERSGEIFFIISLLFFFVFFLKPLYL